MSRYNVLIEMVRDLQPRHIIEIGTWNGKRACQMMAVSNAYYTGFDLFEDATKETDKAEFNVKAHGELVEVAQRIESAGFSRFALIRGNTNETLEKTDVSEFDFAFIDGGHSIETITNDYHWVWDNIEDGGTIVLDDYYTPEVVGMGCNFFASEGEVLKDKDPVAGGGSVSLLVIKK